MKLKQILILFILFNSIINEKTQVINSCGNRCKTNHTMPMNQTDCKDDKEAFCKLVKIKDNDEKEIRFCAVIHGNYDDKDVLKYVREAINVKEIEVLGSNYLMGRNHIIDIIFFYLLLFLF